MHDSKGFRFTCSFGRTFHSLVMSRKNGRKTTVLYAGHCRLLGVVICGRQCSKSMLTRSLAARENPALARTI